MNSTRHRLAGLGASLLILLLTVGTPALLLALGATPWHQNLRHLADLLARPDDGTLALVVIAALAWIAWAVMTVSFLVEIAAAVRGVAPPRLPALGLPQHFAGHLVAIAALLFTVAPTVAAVFAAPPAQAAPVADRHAVVAAPVAVAASTMPPVVAPVVGPVVAGDPGPATVQYKVRRGDSLWKIAEEQLGDGTRYTEIVALNQDALHGRPDFIDAGLVLRLPHDAPTHVTDQAPAGDETYIVQKGDTLWDIARDKLDDPTRYPEIFDASRSTVQPDGAQLRDPDLIRPGWKLTIPGTDAIGPTATDPPTVEGSPVVEAPPVVQAPGDKPAGSTPQGSLATTQGPRVNESMSGHAQAPAEASDDAEADTTSEPGADWLVPGLLGSGALLGGAVLIAVRAHRRTQQRYRVPGRAIAPPPDDVRAVEKTAITTGGPAAEAIDQLDRLLRHLAATTVNPPTLTAAELTQDAVTLHLDEPTGLPAPWQGSGHEWSARLDAPVDDTDVLPPYPLLASVGQDDDGHLWLLDLERLGTIDVTGAPDHALALVRHLAAELALNPWSRIAQVDAIDVADELAALDPVRLRHHRAHDDYFLARLRAEIETSQRIGHGDPEPFHALLLGRTVDSDAVRALVELIRSQQSRSGLAVVRLGTDEPDGVVLDLTADGRLRVPDLGLDVTAAGLSSDEAAACAAIVDLTRDATVVPMPRDDQASGTRAYADHASGTRAYADHAGALVQDLTQPRPSGAAGRRSLLPDTSQRYAAVSAATIQDVETLAPVVPEPVRRTVEDADLDLDRDLAEWRDQHCRRPKLAVLGPVTATVHRAVPRVAERKAYFTELLAFLALHPAGVSSRQVQDAFGLKASRSRTDLALLREWLGTDERMGEQHLPPATSSPAHTARGTSGYQLSGVLVDLDLFRRLRARAQARGAEGMPDLLSALQLVTGQPFSNLRDAGWSWLLDEERVHETATFAAVDVAHIVATDALARQDLHRARFAAETACRAAPYDDICRLDLAKVTEAEGHGERAEEIVHRQVFNRTYDDLPPIDPPDRTRAVAKNNGWGQQRQGNKN